MCCVFTFTLQPHLSHKQAVHKPWTFAFETIVNVTTKRYIHLSSFKTPYVIFLVGKLLDSFPTISLARRLSRIYIEINNFALTAFHFSRFPLTVNTKHRQIW